MSVDGRRAHLEDASTGDRFWADLAEIEEEPAQDDA
jgi:hypothetical protein